MAEARREEDAAAQIIEMATGHWISRILLTVTHLELADRIAEGVDTPEDLAAATGTNAPSLARLLRTLAGFGFLTGTSEGRFRLTQMGELLRTGVPGSLRSTILTLGGPWSWKGWEHFEHSIRTGESGSEKALGMPIFDWLAENPDQASLFSETMVGFHGAEPAAVAKSYDFGGVTTLVDVGGATGNLLTTVIAANPDLKGVLFDLPHVVADAPAFIEEKGLTGRITIEEGSFFDAVPVGADGYMLSHIIHDWTEDKCLKILGHCRDAMDPGGRILIIEMVLPEGDDPHPGKLLDLMMLVGPGGQERTGGEYEELLGKAGLRMKRIVATESAVSVVEAFAD